MTTHGRGSTAGDLLQTPLHGNQGNREAPRIFVSPLGMTIAISRETGARGSSIARRVGRKLGWQVYTQEHLEFLCGDEVQRELVLADVPAEASTWATEQLERFHREQLVAESLEQATMPRLILTLAARGKVVLVGRGAGYLLPRDTTLHLRVVAPLEERIAYMSQLLRLPHEEAAIQVHDRDEKRAEYLMTFFRRRSDDLEEFDFILNSYWLGEDASANLIIAAMQAKELTRFSGKERE